MGNFQIGARKTIPIAQADLWAAVTGPLRSVWLPGEDAQPTPDDSGRLIVSRGDALITVTVSPAKTGTTLGFHEQHLQSAEERDLRGEFWRDKLLELELVLSATLQSLTYRSGASAELLERASTLARDSGRIADEDAWDAIDDIAARIWLDDDQESPSAFPDPVRIRLQCELFDLAPAFSTMMYLSGYFPEMDPASQNAFWVWTQSYLSDPPTEAAASALVKVLADDFEPESIPTEVAQLLVNT